MMNEGVKILLERIKTNPEEFTDGSKWAGVIHGYKAYLGKEDAQALDDAYNGLMQNKFTELVMKELLAPEEDDTMGKPWYTKQGNITLSAGATQGQSIKGAVTLNNNGTVVSWEEREPLVNKKPVLKKHQTLFGKLFNYS